MAEWSYGLLNDFPPFEQTWHDKEGFASALFYVSFMNIKKNGGKGSSNKEEIKEHLIQNKKRLLNQISIIGPDIIVTGLTWKSLRNELFDTVNWKHSGYNIAIGKFKKAKIIDFYHPSARNAAAASYSLLENVVNSSNFKNL